MCNNTHKKKAAGAGKDFTLFFGVKLHFNFKCAVRMSEYTPDLVDDDSGLFPDENTTHDFQSAMFTLYSLPTMHCYPIPQATE